MRFLPVVLLAALAAVLVSQPAPREQVGPVAGGGYLLNSGWRIRPAGAQLPLDTFPMATAASPDGKYLIVMNGGYKPPTLSVINLETSREMERVPVADAWLGLAFSPNGRLLYVGGGSQACVFEFTFSPEGKLAPSRRFDVTPEAERKPQDFVGDVAVSPDGRLVYAARLYRDEVVVINPQSGRVIERFQTGRRPYRIFFHPTGKSLFVSFWAGSAVGQFEADTGRRIAVMSTGAHPTDMAWSSRKVDVEEGAEPEWKARLFVAAAYTNSVYVFGGSDSGDLQRIETINLALHPRQPIGMTPSALALSPDHKRLYVVCSDANAVAVVDISEIRSRVVGFVPTGWYPTAVQALAGNRLVILNGRGVRSFPNPRGPNPAQRTAPSHLGIQAVEYVARIQTGSASFLDPFDDRQLDAYSRTVIENSPYRDSLLDEVPIPDGNPVPRYPGAPSPIEHVVYIVKENRTYDQVFGSLEKGNGLASLTLFNEKVAPNHYKLAREFVLFDNFYVNSDVSADGHNWSTAAIAPDYVQKLWPNSYGGRRKLYDYEGTDPAALPPAGYIWTNALAAGLTVRNYGYLVNNIPKAASGGPQISGVRDSALAPVTNYNYRGFDLEYPDIERAKVFLADLAQFETNNSMPRLVIVRLGNDHTSGTSPGKIAPLAAFADNDYALGLIVEGLSRSKFWPKMAIFVLEDDAQNGADHVDSHRSPAFVLSPYTRRGIIDSSMYNTTSMLRTMELILGLRPMTHFDAGARPMFAAFDVKPDPSPYEPERPRISLEDRNPAASPTAARSLRLDFSEADRIDDDELNDILWRAIRGTEPPAPVRSYFAR